MKGPPSVDICIATFRRPELLRGLLDSLGRQELNGIRARVIVVDNDPEGSARESVDAFRGTTPLPVVYEREPRRGISAARNRALARVEADLLAFVDDDETASPRWLATLADAQRRFDADVVFGPVEHELSPEAPEWARLHSIFRRTNRPTGTRVTHGATNNVLIRRAALGNPPEAFNPAFGLTGGEDTEFSHRLHRAGRRLIWCDEAIVHEKVGAHRATMAWIRQRSYRSGQTYFRIFVRTEPPARKAVWLMKKMVHLCAAAIAWCAAAPLSARIRAEYAAAACRSAGQLSAFAGCAHREEYDAAAGYR
jgi:succinoglycan biosynthesis protein ExoM